jgi:hypothetical protein
MTITFGTGFGWITAPTPAENRILRKLRKACWVVLNAGHPDSHDLYWGA